MQNSEGTSQFTQFLHKKWVRAVLIINALTIILIVGIVIFNATKTATVVFDIAPVDATIQLNKHGDYHNGTYKVHPGTYEITISREGLDSKTINIELKSNYSTNISTFLSQEGKFDFYEQKANFESYQKLAQIASAENNYTTDHDSSAEEFIARYNHAYQLYRDKLPINYVAYREEPRSRSGQTLDKDITIRSSTQCEKTLCIEALMALTDDKSLVKTLLQEKGMDIEDYEVIYKIY